ALDDTTPAQVAMDEADSNVLSYLVLENVAKEYGVTLTDADKAEMEQNLAQQIEESGGEEAFQESLTQLGISRETFDRFSSAAYLLSHLEELAADPSSSLYEAPDQETNAYVDHILLMTIDSETREPLSEEEVQAKQATAGDLLAQLQAAGDVEALFNQLVEEYGEDPGRAADAGYLVTPETSFVPEFLDAAFALQPGELSGIVESDYGYHILLRKELTGEQLASLTSQHTTDVLSERLESALDEAARSEKLDGINAGEFYTGYMDIIEKIMADAEVYGAASGSTGGTQE
ncbi:MAG: peptidylprolyl isomerase, partial [Oscillospiraceae bacterium]|nr:peptidylprolyl isomerase [Oscillospiraceae bacterium]